MRLLGPGLVAGLLLAASLPPFGWWPLGLAGVALLAWMLDGKRGPLSRRGRLAVGGAAGVGLYATSLWWVTEFHAAGFVVLVLMESVILALGVLAAGRSRLAVALPAALVLAEAVRGRWPFGGLPLAGIDLGQVGGPLLPVARLGGHLLLVGMVGVAGVGLAQLFAGRWVAGGLCLGLVAATAAAGALAPNGRNGERLGVAALQGGGQRGIRAVDTDPSTVFETHVAASAGVDTSRTGLVLWPEDVVDVDDTFTGSVEESTVMEVARRLGLPMVVGVVEDVSDSRFRNAAVAFSAEGRVVDRYDKVHRVPFGEYIPFRSFIDRIADVSVIPRDAVAGEGPGLLVTPVGPLAVVISYEVFFADRARSGAAAGGRLLLVPTNASSFTTSQVPTQEVAAARLRAVETGRWVVQAAPTGFSAVIDADGRVLRRGPLGDRAVLHGDVRLRTGRTPAVRLGDAPIVVLAVIFLVTTRLRTRKLE